MSDSLRTYRDVYDVYRDQVASLDFMWQSRSRLMAGARPGSLFYGLSVSELEIRLREDRTELDHWAAMVMMASFEAMVWTDAKNRLDKRNKDSLWHLIREIYQQAEQNWRKVRFVDLLDQYHQCSSISVERKQTLRRLLDFRHWIAHGRHWTLKTGHKPLGPGEVLQILEDHRDALRSDWGDFPLA